MKTNIYVDGFNLYFRLLKDNPSLKWLNLKLLAEQLLSPANQIAAVRYYAARVSGRLDAEASRRQQVYLAALATVPEITVHMGNFLTAPKWAGLVHPPQTRPPTIISKPWPARGQGMEGRGEGQRRESGRHLLRDAFRQSFDVAACSPTTPIWSSRSGSWLRRSAGRWAALPGGEAG